MILEKDIQRQIFDWLSLRRIFYYRQNTGATVSEYKGKKRFFRYGVAGSPDIICVFNGQYIGVETKGPKGKQSPAQAVFEKNLVEAGGKYILAYCLEDVIESFNKL